MPEERNAVKLDFVSGLENIPPRPKVDGSTTRASVLAGRELGFSARTESPTLDGRRLRSRGADKQLNLKVTAEEKDLILRDATRLIQDPDSRVNNIGEFVVLAVDFYRRHHHENGQ